MSTITREFTKEQLITQAQENVAQWRDAMQHNVNTEYAAIRLRLAEIALASLEAEPVAWRYRFVHTPKSEEHGSPFTTDWVLAHSEEECNPSDCFDRQPLYTAPPAPVSVPDESAVELLATDLMKRIDKITGERHSVATLSSLRVSIVESCRSTMLQGAAGNSPVIPDGWVACSERMPEDAQWCAVNTEYGYYVQCWSEGQGWLGDEISIPNSDVTHWMPLPAAPQQEAKNV